MIIKTKRNLIENYLNQCSRNAFENCQKLKNNFHWLLLILFNFLETTWKMSINWNFYSLENSLRKSFETTQSFTKDTQFDINLSVNKLIRWFIRGRSRGRVAGMDLVQGSTNLIDIWPKRQCGKNNRKMKRRKSKKGLQVGAEQRNKRHEESGKENR